MLTKRFKSEFELDTDILDEESITHLHSDVPNSGSSDEHDQRMPLLVGLVDQSAARRSIDIPLMSHGDASHGDAELADLAASRTAGGSMLDSVANMANSILGAGESCRSFKFLHPINEYQKIRYHRYVQRITMTDSSEF